MTSAWQWSDQWYTGIVFDHAARPSREEMEKVLEVKMQVRTDRQ